MTTSRPTIPVKTLNALWSLATRIAFRFCFVYFVLYSISTGAAINLVSSSWSPPATFWPIRQIVVWTAAYIFRFKLASLEMGDSPFAYVLTFCLLVIALLVTGTWTALDRGREDNTRLYKWFRLFMRFVLGATMIAYGMIKVIPVQMTDPSLSDLVTPFGSLLPQRVLWTSIGAAPVYEIFAGCAEVLGGILLFIPRSVMLGALICLADLVQVFMLNVGYDVQVKLYSFHLLLMAVLLLAPDLPRLANLFFMNRAAGPSTQPQLFLARRANRRALAAQILVGIWLLGMNSYRDWHRWHVEGSAAPKPPLYGIWDVEQFSIDGQIRAPLFTDRECWRRAIFNSGYFSNRVVFQRMDDSLYFAALDFNGKTLSLTTPFDKNWKATFAVQRVEQDQLTLDGEMGGHKVHAQLRLFDHNKFPLVNHRMGWIRE